MQAKWIQLDLTQTPVKYSESRLEQGRRKMQTKNKPFLGNLFL